LATPERETGKSYLLDLAQDLGPVPLIEIVGGIEANGLVVSGQRFRVALEIVEYVTTTIIGIGIAGV
jgi:hypothetical protein